MADNNYCMHGCYPVDNRYYIEDGLPVDSLEDFFGEESDMLLERIQEEGIGKIGDIADLRKVIRIVKNNSEIPETRLEIGEKIVDTMNEELNYYGDLGEPYVGIDPERKIGIGASSQGVPMDSYFFFIDMIDYRYDYDVEKVREHISISLKSQYYQEMSERRKRAENSIRETMGNISDLYQQKHLLEHDIRKLEERVKSFDQAEEGMDEALKADFVDLVDANTGKHSILQMQANNIFPSITADFYRMETEEDLIEDGTLSDLPESEKAMLRKKWRLYQNWKEEFGKNVRQKLEDLEMRYNSIKTSIEQTEEWLRPYVRTVKQVHGTEQEDLDRLTDPYLVQGYASSWRDIKLICKQRGNSHYQDVIVPKIQHLTVGGTKQPNAPGGGGEAVIFDLKEYLVCDHVYEEVFQPQIEAKKSEVKRFIERYRGNEAPEQEEEESLEDVEKPPKLKNRFLGLLGKVDEYYRPLDAITEMRACMVGPDHTINVYADIKYGVGTFVMD